MLNFLLFTIFFLCLLLGPIRGWTLSPDQALFSGAENALRLCLELGPALCLWSMLLELMERIGMSALLSRLLSPLLRRLFPRGWAHEQIREALSENLGANLLGLGNAATPAGIRAARGLAGLSGGRASDELCLLVVLNTASLQLVPATVAALRAAAGSEAPFEILPAVWICSLCSVLAGLGAAALCRRIWP